MKTPFTGGCMCGEIRYECTAEPIFMGNCHCRDCQQATGTAFAAAMLVPRNAVTIAGDVKYYSTSGYYEAQFYSYSFPVLTFDTVCVPHSSRKCCIMLRVIVEV
jgi:hypothetical protein